MTFSHSVELFYESIGATVAAPPAPDFWPTLPDQSSNLINGLERWTSQTIGQSKAGRPILALEYGDLPTLSGTTSRSLHSSLAAGLLLPPTEIFPESFYGVGSRDKPVVVIQCGIHGGEYTGTAAALNLCSIVDRGVDLRGREWPTLHKLATQSVIRVIPWLNPDGASRWLFPNTNRVPTKWLTANTHGLQPDGQPGSYRGQKSFFPLDPTAVGFLGTYYNDEGVNLQYDLFQPEPQPETLAWMRYYQEIRPDAVVNFHCDSGSIMGWPDAYLPSGHQNLFIRLAGQVAARLNRERLPVRRLSFADLPSSVRPFMDQNTAIYHTCGALPLMAELPIGSGESSPWTLDTMLDCGLLVLEEIFTAAFLDGLRPFTTKVPRNFS